MHSNRGGSPCVMELGVGSLRSSSPLLSVEAHCPTAGSFCPQPMNALVHFSNSKRTVRVKEDAADICQRKRLETDQEHLMFC